MWTSVDRAGVARGQRLGTPHYIIRAEDLKPSMGTCPVCRGIKTILIPSIPPGQEGGAGQRPPSYEEVSGYTKFIRPWADSYPCSYCELAQAIGQHFPARSATPSGIEDPASAELRALRAALAPPAPPASVWTPPGDAIVPTGAVFITEAAGVELEKFHGANLIAQGLNAAGVADIGRKFAVEYLNRHARGDCGLVGILADGDPMLGSELGPVATRLDRNALAVTADRGTVASVYRLTRTERRRTELGVLGPPVEAERDYLHVRTELHPTRDTLTLVHLPGEVPE